MGDSLGEPSCPECETSPGGVNDLARFLTGQQTTRHTP